MSPSDGGTECRLPFPFAANSRLAEKGSRAQDLTKALAGNRLFVAPDLGRRILIFLRSRCGNLTPKSDEKVASRTFGYCLPRRCALLSFVFHASTVIRRTCASRRHNQDGQERASEASGRRTTAHARGTVAPPVASPAAKTVTSPQYLECAILCIARMHIKKKDSLKCRFSS